MSFYPFYLTYIQMEALKDTEYGVKVNGVFLTTIRYTHDTLIFCDSMESLQLLVNKVSGAGVEQKMNIHV